MLLSRAAAGCHGLRTVGLHAAAAMMAAQKATTRGGTTRSQASTKRLADDQPGTSAAAASRRKVQTSAAAAAGWAGGASGSSAGSKQQQQQQAQQQGTPQGEGVGQRAFFLLKSEPDEFSVDDLGASKDATAPWDGVRSFQARNVMRGMRAGDRALFYHSSCKVPGVVGVVEVAREAYADASAWDAGSPYYDPKSKEGEDPPRWVMVDVRLVRKLSRCISLEELKGYRESALAGMVLLQRGRLSVQPVTRAEWDFVLSLEEEGGQGGETK